MTVKQINAKSRRLHKAHVALWTWIAENPDKPKDAWPRWHLYERSGRRVAQHCFACEATNLYPGVSACHMCPLKPHALVRTNHQNVFSCLGGLYGDYCCAPVADKPAIARVIAGLGWYIPTAKKVVTK